MSRNIVVETLRSPRPAEQAIEVVERKGVGHPDSICDAVCEAISIALSQEYLSRFGRVLHHNIDKGLLIAGQVDHEFGGGRQAKKMRLVVGDRATYKFGGHTIAVGDIATTAARKWLAANLRHVDPAEHLLLENALAPGSPELSGIFESEAEVLSANDTSAAVGCYPLTDTERVVLATERYLNSPQFKAEFPDTGEDIKVMGTRRHDRLELTIAMPLLESEVADETSYFERKESIRQAIADFAEAVRGGLAEVSIRLNALDRPGRGLAGVYVSLLGTSAEDADSGQVGRGNRVNGLLSLNRPASAEAAAGKNPVSHVGKIYSVLTHRLAERIYREVPGVLEASVWMCSRIGDPVDQPAIASVLFVPHPDADPSEIASLATELVDAELDALPQFCLDLAAGVYPIL